MDKIIEDLATLRTGTVKAGIEFKGFTKTITSVAASTEGAGKAWTTFSRLVSGTPIWAFQNKLRAYLSILAGFEKRSQANADAMSEETEQMLKKIKGYKSLNEQMKPLIDNEEEIIRLGAESAKAQQIINENVEEAIKQSKEYQQVLMGGGSEQAATMRSIKFLKQRKKLVDNEQLQLQKTVKLAYAYDKTRIKEAKELSKIQGKGRIGQFFAGRSERKSMRKDQSSALKTAKGDAGSAIYGGVKENLKNAKMLLAPLLIVTKSAKAIYTAVNPMSSGAKKFRTKMYGLIQKLQPLFSILFKYLIMGMLAIAGFFVILTFMKRYYEILQEFGIIDEIKELGMLAFDFLKTGWKALSAFISGDYQKALDHLTVFVDKGIVLLIKTGKVLAKMAFLALVAGFELLMDAVYKFYKDPAFRKQVMGILMKVALVVVGLIVVQFLIGVALSIAATFALPILLGVVILAALYTVARWLDNKFGEYDIHNI